MQKGRLQAGLYCVVHVVIILVDSQWFGLSRGGWPLLCPGERHHHAPSCDVQKRVQEKTLVDINKLVSSVLALARIDLQKHKIELQAQLDDRFPKVLSNQVQLQQVILNLVMNAIEAMSSSQTRVLRIQTELSQSNKVHVSIEDTGTGIKPSDVARVFKPMFTTKARGMGMGLSICQSIIENHDGRIWVSPGTNGGSIFQFELPTIANKD
ncbi:MAG: ATP-binding protein [Pseudolabrys sp.]